MIISPARGFIFVHIPKTGGTSLSLALERAAPETDILIGDTPEARARAGRLRGMRARGKLWKHATLADIDGLLPADEMARLFVLTLVRNPWDRMVSYYHWLRVQSFAHAAVSLAKSCDFAAFIRHPQTRLGMQRRPARSYVTTARGVERCTLFARLEHLEADLAPFEAHLGQTLLPLPRVNASRRPTDWRTAYDAQGAALVAQDCAEDIRRFGYTFDGG